MKCECISCATCVGTGRQSWLEDDDPCDDCQGSGVTEQCYACAEADRDAEAKEYHSYLAQAEEKRRTGQQALK